MNSNAAHRQPNPAIVDATLLLATVTIAPAVMDTTDTSHVRQALNNIARQKYQGGAPSTWQKRCDTHRHQQACAEAVVPVGYNGDIRVRLRHIATPEADRKIGFAPASIGR